MRKSELRKKTRVLLVDDHPLVRQALGEAIVREGDLEVCGEAEDRTGALAAMAVSKPDLVILDLSLKNSDGLGLIRDIDNRFPKTPTLVLSMHDETLHAERVIRAGASGYISKQEACTQVVQAVRRILAGEIYWSPRAAAGVANRHVSATRGGRGGGNLHTMDRLSERELEVFELIGTGASTQQIAAQLHIDASTVETYRVRIKAKLNLKDATELLQAAIRWTLAKAGACETTSI